jgi:hypothetical protein
MGHEGFEKSAQDHGIGDIGALELVETQYVALGCDISCHKRDSVNVVAMLHLHSVQALVYILHEVVEVYACLRLDSGRQRVVEEVHHHRLAATDIAVQVESSR